MHRLAGLVGVFVLAFPGSVYAQDATDAGAATAPYPTFENISLEWAITGDDNANGVVQVRYRRAGDSEYRQGLPLFRVPAGSNEGFDWTNKHSGSLFGLEPGTQYEIELTLADPDGGDATETLTATTRSLPQIPADGREIAVTPSEIDAALDALQPGDVLVLADGTYSELVVPNSGTASEAVTVRAETPGGAVVEGDVRIDNRAFVQIEDLTVHGQIKFNDAEAIVVSGCHIETTGDGIVSYGDGVTNAYIVNNVIQGATGWNEGALGVDGDNVGEGIVLTGPGNVVAFNRVSGFRDCLSLLEDSEAVAQVSNDFYGNDLSACADDAIEADFAMGNVRVYHNRIRESFMGISSQPSLGGPTYFLRNVMYNVRYQAFKLQRDSVGDVVLHNTIVKSGDAFSVRTDDPISRAYFRNNLFLGGPGGEYGGYDSGPGQVMDLRSADDSCSFDYDGYGSVGSGSYEGRVGGASFSSLEQQRANTSEANAVEVDLAVFAASVEYPADPFDPPALPSFVLTADGAAIDRGMLLANVNDGFSGDAPDLGAIEAGSEEPSYGPDGAIPDSGGGDPGAGGGAGSDGVDSSASGGSAATTSTGGASGTASGSGGADATSAGATGASSGASDDSGATTTAGSASSADSGGCGCRTAPRAPGSSWLWLLVGLAGVWRLRVRGG